MARARQFGSLFSFTWGNPLKRGIGKVPLLKLQKQRNCANSLLDTHPTPDAPHAGARSLRGSAAPSSAPVASATAGPLCCLPEFPLLLSLEAFGQTAGLHCQAPTSALATDGEGSREGGAT